MVKIVPNLKWAGAILAFECIFSSYAMAQPLEDIRVQELADKIVVSINLSGPVHYLRNSPSENGQMLEIFYERLPDVTPAEPWLDNETRKSPASALLPGFTVTTRNQKIQPKLVVVFSRPVVYSVSPGKDNRSFLLTFNVSRDASTDQGAALPLLPEAQLPGAAAPPVSGGVSAPVATQAQDINKQAAGLMVEARNAMLASNNTVAIEKFNSLLLLPPNNYTQDAQEWVGVARERAGQPHKAKVEYELYLKVYSTGPGVDRVRQRLAKLGAKPVQAPVSVTAERAAGKPAVSQRMTYGSVSMHYYRGASTINSTAQTATGVKQTDLSLIDQSALLTTVDVTERFISEDYDNRLVFRDADYHNFLENKPGKNRVNAAYFELKNRKEDYSGRFGRQSSSGAGVMGRFDGANVGYGVMPGLRINAVAGQLADMTVGPKPVFYGVSADAGPVTLYVINQTAEGIADRRAIGSELRYFDQGKTAYGVLDYDTLYSTVNIALLQGTIGGGTETAYNFLLDHRKAPYISTRNALNGAMTTSLSELLLTMTEEQLQQLATDRTATSNLAQVGVTRQIAEKWQLGADVRVANFSSMPATGTDPTTTGVFAPEGFVPAIPAISNEWTVTPQLIGSNLYSNQDVTVFSLGFTKGEMTTGQSLFVYSRAVLMEKWMLDASMQLYRMNFQTTNAEMSRVMPMLRISYQVKQKLSLDGEAGLEMSRMSDNTQTTNTKRQFFSFGFRWDF